MEYLMVVSKVVCFLDASKAFDRVNHRTLFKAKFRKYPSIHTNYIISQSTTLKYNHII